MDKVCCLSPNKEANKPTFLKSQHAPLSMCAWPCLSFGYSSNKRKKMLFAEGRMGQIDCSEHPGGAHMERPGGSAGEDLPTMTTM